jgi:phenylacetic acid degradation operon negative regulatory protein
MKGIKRIIYKGKRASKSLLNECIEGFLFLLWLSTPPYMSKIFYAALSDDFSPKAVFSHLNRLYKKGYIQKIKKKKRVFFKLKISPKEIIFNELEKLKTHKAKEKWDKVWHLIIYDIPEKFRYKRDALRSFLKELGFGKVQESCWVSPYNFSSLLYQFCKFHKILKYICIYEGKFFTGKNIDVLVEEIWHLNDLNKEYQELINLCKEEIETIETASIEIARCYRRYHRVYSIYKSLIKEDPFLPREFLKGFLREKAEGVFKKLTSLVSKELTLLQNISSYKYDARHIYV